MESIQYAEWAAPIVPVLKQSVRICGDFKLTANRASKLDRYPIPKIEDLFAKLAGGKTFSQLDLSQAYQQLPLDQKSKSYVVINTQRGLFRYNRLPYEVSSALGIFQRTMESILQGIPYVVVYLDDIDNWLNPPRAYQSAGWGAYPHWEGRVAPQEEQMLIYGPICYLLRATDWCRRVPHSGRQSQGCQWGT